MSSWFSGSTREHFSQMEIQLLQMKRLHQMQDEYLQCLSRNDKLLIEYDQVLEVMLRFVSHALGFGGNALFCQSCSVEVRMSE